MDTDHSFLSARSLLKHSPDYRWTQYDHTDSSFRPTPPRTARKPKTPTHHADPSRPCIDVLCEQFDGMLADELGVSLTKLYPTIPDHDKRILNCMMLKRFSDTMDTQNAWIARDYWDRERRERAAIQRRQESDYQQSVRRKQELERCVRAERLEALCRQRQSYVTAVRRELHSKKVRSSQRLAQAAYERDLMAAQRQTHAQRRAAETTNIRFRQQIDAQLRSHECGAELDRRMQRATRIRRHHLNSYRKRIAHNNERHRMVHDIIATEIRAAEQSHADHLKEKIARCNRRTQTLRLNKLQWVEESRDRAQLTATLRDIVRKSVTPDNFLCAA